MLLTGLPIDPQDNRQRVGIAELAFMGQDTPTENASPTTGQTEDAG